MRQSPLTASLGGVNVWQLYNPNQPAVSGVIIFNVTGWRWWSLVTARWRWFPTVGGSAALVQIFQGASLVIEALAPTLATIAVETDVSAHTGSPLPSPLNQIGVVSLPPAVIFGDGTINLSANIVNVADVMSLTTVLLCGELL